MILIYSDLIRRYTEMETDFSECVILLLEDSSVILDCIYNPPKDIPYHWTAQSF